MAEFRLVIKRDFCKSCDLCIHFCPKKILGHDKELNKLGFLPVIVTDRDRCIGCGRCALICPEACIEIYKEG